MRALSPILSTMILLSAVLIAGIMLYAYFTSTMTGLTKAPNVAVEQVVYYPDTSIISVRVRNYGAVPVTLTKMYIQTASGGCEIQLNGTTGIALKPSDAITINEVINSSTCATTNLQAILNELAAGSGVVWVEFSYGAGKTGQTSATKIVLG